LRSTTDFNQSFAVTLHLAISAQPHQRVLQNPRRILIWRDYDPVVHPWSLSARPNNARSAQIRQMATDFWLIGLEDLDEKANAHFVLTHEMKQPQARSVSQGAKE
jgi:hypothetical protein